MPKKIRENHAETIRKLEGFLGDMESRHNRVVTRKELSAFEDQNSDMNTTWISQDQAYRVGRGEYMVPTADGKFNPADPATNFSVSPDSATTAVAEPQIDSRIHAVHAVDRAQEAQSEVDAERYDAPTDSASLSIDQRIEDARTSRQGEFVPSPLAGYSKFGNWRDLHRIIKSGVFMNSMVTGPAGNGKTTMIEQICADLGREMFRVNITAETDEMDLLGGFRLQNGSTVFELGPVVMAMLRGAVLLLDEVDLASNNIMCLQPVLEGKGIYIKKINRWIRPAPGFVVIATGNTKGQGDDSGSFVGTNFLNEAFLDRFAITVEQPYPNASQEKRILRDFWTKNLGLEKTEEFTNFIDLLTRWGESIRGRYQQGDIGDVVSTRRLLDMLKHYSIFRDEIKAVKACVSRFNEETKLLFIDFFEKMVDPPADENTSTGIEYGSSYTGSSTF